MATKKQSECVGKWCLVTDYHRGIIYGFVKEFDRKEGRVVLENARHVWWYTCAGNGENGPYSLATSGPQKESKVSPVIPYHERLQICSVTPCSDAAIKAFKVAKWG